MLFIRFAIVAAVMLAIGKPLGKPAAGRGCSYCGEYCDCWSNIGPDGNCGRCVGVKLDTLKPERPSPPRIGD